MNKADIDLIIWAINRFGVERYGAPRRKLATWDNLSSFNEDFIIDCLECCVESAKSKKKVIERAKRLIETIESVGGCHAAFERSPDKEPKGTIPSKEAP